MSGLEEGLFTSSGVGYVELLWNDQPGTYPAKIRASLTKIHGSIPAMIVALFGLSTTPGYRYMQVQNKHGDMLL